jgi:hypothetical protein
MKSSILPTFQTCTWGEGFEALRLCTGCQHLQPLKPCVPSKNRTSLGWNSLAPVRQDDLITIITESRPVDTLEGPCGHVSRLVPGRGSVCTICLSALSIEDERMVD